MLGIIDEQSPPTLVRSTPSLKHCVAQDLDHSGSSTETSEGPLAIFAQYSQLVNTMLCAVDSCVRAQQIVLRHDTRTDSEFSQGLPSPLPRHGYG